MRIVVLVACLLVTTAICADAVVLDRGPTKKWYYQSIEQLGAMAACRFDDTNNEISMVVHISAVIIAKYGGYTTDAFTVCYGDDGSFASSDDHTRLTLAEDEREAFYNTTVIFGDIGLKCPTHANIICVLAVRDPWAKYSYPEQMLPIRIEALYQPVQIYVSTME